MISNVCVMLIMHSSIVIIIIIMIIIIGSSSSSSSSSRSIIIAVCYSYTYYRTAAGCSTAAGQPGGSPRPDRGRAPRLAGSRWFPSCQGSSYFAIVFATLDEHMC